MPERHFFQKLLSTFSVEEIFFPPPYIFLYVSPRLCTAITDCAVCVRDCEAARKASDVNYLLGGGVKIEIATRPPRSKSSSRMERARIPITLLTLRGEVWAAKIRISLYFIIVMRR